MKKCGLYLFLTIFVFLALTAPPRTVYAQDWEATAQAADQAQRDAQYRVNSAAATAEYARQQATQAANATATAAHAQSQATQTAHAQRATATAASVQATAAAIDATKTALELSAAQASATAQAQAWQAQATSQALVIQQQRQDASHNRRVNNAIYGIVFFVLVTFFIVGLTFSNRWLQFVYGRRQEQQRAVPFDTVIVDVDPEPVKPAAALPPRTGWRPAYLRPKK